MMAREVAFISLAAELLEDRGTRPLVMHGRLKPGVTREQAQEQLRVIAARFSEQYPETNDGRTASVVPAGDVRINPTIDAQMTPVAAVMMSLVDLPSALAS